MLCVICSKEVNFDRDYNVVSCECGYKLNLYTNNVKDVEKLAHFISRNFELEKVIEEGRIAASDGLDSSLNPYENSYLKSMWLKGYEERSSYLSSSAALFSAGKEMDALKEENLQLTKEKLHLLNSRNEVMERLNQSLAKSCLVTAHIVEFLKATLPSSLPLWGKKRYLIRKIDEFHTKLSEGISSEKR